MTEPSMSITCGLSEGAATIITPDGRELATTCTGAAGGFSPAELLHAALGSCVSASIAPLLARHGADVTRARISVTARDASLARGVDVRVALPAGSDELLARCRRAVAKCPVLRALNIPVDIHWQMN